MGAVRIQYDCWCHQKNSPTEAVARSPRRSRFIKQTGTSRGWALAALDSIPSTLKGIGEELETLYREQQKVERDLSRIPSDEMLVPLTQGLTEARARAADANLLAAQKRAELANLAQSQADAEAAYAKQIDAIASKNSQRSSLERSATIQAVLAEFKNALVVKKIKDVKLEVTRCFDEDGEITEEGRFRTSESGVAKRFEEMDHARVAMEAGTHFDLDL
jgi:hypothetical protein